MTQMYALIPIVLIVFVFQVDNLKEKLAIQEVELKIKNDAADKLIQIVGVETEKVSKEKSFGMI